MVHQEDPRGSSPQERGQTAGNRASQGNPEAEGSRKAGQDPQHERAVDETNPRFGQQVLRVPALVGDLHLAEHPSNVRVHQAAERTAESRAVPVRGCAAVH